MGSNTEGRQSDEKVIMDTEMACWQSIIPKVRPQKDVNFLDEMIPSISNHRCGPNSRLTSPSSIRKKLGNPGEDLQVSPRTKMVELAASLVSSTLKKDLEYMTIQLENHGDPSTLVEQNEVQQDNSACKYHNTLTPMIIDTGDDIGIGGCPTDYECEDFASEDFVTEEELPDKEQMTKAFCPNRMPRRSSMASEVSDRRPSIQTRGETYEILLPGRLSPVERRRSITFDDNMNIKSIEPIQLLSPSGAQSFWYQDYEYETIKLKTLALLDRVDHTSGVVDGKKYCMRGLEKFMSPEATEVKKHQAWDAVLNEQFLQRKDGEFDEETLANIYKYSTQRSKKEASRRAIRDAEASEAYLKINFQSPSSLDKESLQRNYDRRVSF